MLSAPLEPLHLPESRRWDRRAGRISSRLHGALSEPTGSRDGWRPPDDKRRALRRLLARRRLPSLRLWLAGLGLSVVALGVLIATLLTPDFDEPRPLAEAPAAYARLVGLVAETCGAEPCAFGLRMASDPPAAVRRAMARLRVRTAEHDPIYAETRLRGTIAATHHLVYHHPAAPDVVALRARRTAFFARQDSLRAVRRQGVYTPAEPLGEGWWRVPGR